MHQPHYQCREYQSPRRTSSRHLGCHSSYPYAGSCTATLQAIASPTSLPAALPTVHPPSAWPIPSPTYPLPVCPGQHQCNICKQCWNHSSPWRFPVYGKCTQWSDIIFYLAPAPYQEWNSVDDCKIDTGAQVNTIPLSKYQKLFPHKINDSRYPKPSSLSPTAHTWMSHNGSPKPFLGHFVAEVQHATEPRSYPTCFYVFEGSTSCQILLSYVTSERLGILEFKVPNLAATSQIDDLNVLSSPTPSSKRKTTKSVTFCDPLVHLDQLCSTSSPQGLSGMR